MRYTQHGMNINVVSPMAQHLQQVCTPPLCVNCVWLCVLIASHSVGANGVLQYKAHKVAILYTTPPPTMLLSTCCRHPTLVINSLYTQQSTLPRIRCIYGTELPNVRHTISSFPCLCDPPWSEIYVNQGLVPSKPKSMAPTFHTFRATSILKYSCR